jgi:hypothetical protein
LLDKNDEELTASQIKKKRMQKMHKKSAEVREQKRQKQEEE